MMFRKTKSNNFFAVDDSLDQIQPFEDGDQEAANDVVDAAQGMPRAPKTAFAESGSQGGAYDDLSAGLDQNTPKPKGSAERDAGGKDQAEDVDDDDDGSNILKQIEKMMREAEELQR